MRLTVAALSMSAEIRKQRLRRLEIVFVRSPIYFVTTCEQTVATFWQRRQNFSAFWERRPFAWSMDRRVRDYARSFARIRRN
jgi:hypothetical protein